MDTEIDYKDIEMFTKGGCHLLALRIAEKTGWQPCAFYTTEVGFHAFVRTPNGNYLDVEGEHSEVGLLEYWSQERIVEVEGLCDFPRSDWYQPDEISYRWSNFFERLEAVSDRLIIDFLQEHDQKGVLPCSSKSRSNLVDIRDHVLDEESDLILDDIEESLEVNEVVS